MKLQKMIDGRMITYHRCDSCGQICENDDYMGDDDNTMCIDCWNKIRARKQNEPAASACS